MFGFGTKTKAPPALLAALRPDEEVLAAAVEAGGGRLVVTRYGLWRLPPGAEPTLVPWSLISKAKWQAPILHLVRADVIGELAGAQLILDHHPFNFEIAAPGRLTDVIHSRIRGGIISSTHHEFPGGGAWVVVRRIPGQDGPLAQVRLDPGTDPATAAEWLTPVVDAAMEPFRSPR